MIVSLGTSDENLCVRLVGNENIGLYFKSSKPFPEFLVNVSVFFCTYYF